MILISSPGGAKYDLTSINSNCSTQRGHFSEVKWWHFSKYYSTGEVHFPLPLQLHRSKIWLNCCSLIVDGTWLFFPSSFCFIWGRIVELFCKGPISPYWGVLSKCLAYSKAASDPFVYSLLRHQYRKTFSFLANKVLKRSPLNSSSLVMENNAGQSNNNINTTNSIQAPTNKLQWRSSLSESTLPS